MKWLAATCLSFLLTGGPASAGEPVPGQRFRDCPKCPEMVVVPGGAFTLGSPAGERGRAADEGPQSRVTIDGPLAAGRFEITRGEYEAFVKATGRRVSGGCITDRVVRGKWEPHPATTLRDPGFAQTDRHPVVCVSWDDAQAYVDWLGARTGKAYRLPREAEWEYLARAGTTTAYPWGDDVNVGCAHMNGTDRMSHAKYADLEVPPDNVHATCSDGALNTAPVGSYRANAFGLHDMVGNVGEWTADCVTPSYAEIGTDGRPRDPDCARRMVRGGGWGTFTRQLRSAERIRYAPTDRDDTIGIRVVRDLR